MLAKNPTMKRIVSSALAVTMAVSMASTAALASEGGDEEMPSIVDPGFTVSVDETTAQPEVSGEPETTEEPEVSGEPETTAEPETTETVEDTDDTLPVVDPGFTILIDETNEPEITEEPEEEAAPQDEVLENGMNVSGDDVKVEEYHVLNSALAAMRAQAEAEDGRLTKRGVTFTELVFTFRDGYTVNAGPLIGMWRATVEGISNNRQPENLTGITLRYYDWFRVKTYSYTFTPDQLQAVRYEAGLLDYAEICINDEPSTVYYTVTLDYGYQFDEKSSGTCSYVTVEEGNCLSLEELEREGYQFEGWYSDKTWTEQFDTTTAIYRDMTLYAGWSELPEEPTPTPSTDPTPTPSTDPTPTPSTDPTPTPSTDPTPTPSTDPTPTPSTDPTPTPSTDPTPTPSTEPTPTPSTEPTPTPNTDLKPTYPPYVPDDEDDKEDVVVIEDEDTPLTSAPVATEEEPADTEAEIVEEETPLNSQPEATEEPAEVNHADIAVEEAPVEILDAGVALGDLPQTGAVATAVNPVTSAGLVAMAFSMAGCGLYFTFGRQKDEEED